MNNKENLFKFLSTGSLQAFQRLSLLICYCCSLLGWNQRVRTRMLLQGFEANRPQLMPLDLRPHIHYSLAHNKFDIPAAKPPLLPLFKSCQVSKASQPQNRHPAVPNPVYTRKRLNHLPWGKTCGSQEILCFTFPATAANSGFFVMNVRGNLQLAQAVYAHT